MTKEEKIELLEKEKAYMLSHGGDRQAIAIDTAIKALRQEPCEDCVNRQAVLNTLFYKSDNNCEVVLNKELQDRIKALPSVTPQPFINKPCVSEGVCREDKIQVLDKIRTEIKALTDGAEPEHIWNVDVLAIIDKYKESEGEE